MKERGFQLLELMIVCLLVSLATLAGLQAFQEMASRQRLQAGCQSFVSAVNEARNLAVNRNLAVEIRVSPDSQSFSLSTPKAPSRLWRRLPEGVRFVGTPRRAVTFYSRGAASPAGSYRLANRSGEMGVIVAVSGRVRWERHR